MLSESDEKLQKGIIELDKGNDKKAFGYFKEVFESRQEKLLLKVQDNPKSPTLMLDALYMVHALVWLRVAEAGKDRSRSTELMGKAVGTVEAARTALGVDPIGTDNSTDVTLAGTPDYITLSGQVITLGLVPATGLFRLVPDDLQPAHNRRKRCPQLVSCLLGHAYPDKALLPCLHRSETEEPQQHKYGDNAKLYVWSILKFTRQVRWPVMDQQPKCLVFYNDLYFFS